MKITFNFDRDCRAFNMEPEDDLEFHVLKEMESQCRKGQSISLTSVSHPDNDLIRDFRVEMRVNGHQARVQKENHMSAPGELKHPTGYIFCPDLKDSSRKLDK